MAILFGNILQFLNRGVSILLQQSCLVTRCHRVVAKPVFQMYMVRGLKLKLAEAAQIQHLHPASTVSAKVLISHVLLNETSKQVLNQKFYLRK